MAPVYPLADPDSRNVTSRGPPHTLGPMDRENEAQRSRLPGTPEAFLAVLTSKITQYDALLSARERKRGLANIYRLGLLLAAVDRVRGDLLVEDLHLDTREALMRFRQAVLEHMEPEFPPVKATLRQVDEFLLRGKAPSLVRS